MTDTDQSIEEQQKAAARRAELELLVPISYDEMMQVFHKWMLIADPYLIKFCLSCYCANELSQRAVWAIIIGPSGGGKTEVLNSLLPLKKIFPLSTITTQTFLSGMPSTRDQSLLPKITNHMILIKDYTVILSMQKDAQAELQGQFRDIHDGAMTKVFGNGKSRDWSGKVSMLAACTEMYDSHQQRYAALGERFVNYRPIMPDRHEVARRSLANSAKQQDMTRELQNAVYAFIKGIDFTQYLTLPELPTEAQNELIDLAEFVTKSRSAVIRDFGMKKEILFVPTPEMPTRILQQVALVGQGAMILNSGALKEEDMGMMYKVMLDSIPRTNVMVIKEMARSDAQTSREIADALGYPTPTISTYLENLAMLNVCSRKKGTEKGDGNDHRWTLHPQYAEIIRRHYDIKTVEQQFNQEKALAENIAEVFPEVEVEQEVRNPYDEPPPEPEPLPDTIKALL